MGKVKEKKGSIGLPFLHCKIGPTTKNGWKNNEPLRCSILQALIKVDFETHRDIFSHWPPRLGMNSFHPKVLNKRKENVKKAASYFWDVKVPVWPSWEAC